MLWKSFIVAGMAYGVLLALSYFFQKKLIFKPETVPRHFDYGLGEGEKEVFLTTSDGITINGLHLQIPDSDGVVLYLHGNAQCLKDWWYLSRDFREYDYDILMIDYRGYGKSEGTMSEEGLYNDAEAAYQYLLEQGYDESDIVIYGVSIGSGVAMEMAIRKKAKALILECPFISLKKIAWNHFPYLLPNLLLRFEFNNLKKASNVNIPVLIFHGDADEVIPYQHGQRLAQAFPVKEKKMVLIPAATHSDIPEHLEYRLELGKFLKQLGKKEPVNESES